MKQGYLYIKEELRSIREEYNGIASKTEKILELSKTFEKMECFHKILSKGMEDKVR
jgi:hypothetical protein